MIRVFISYSEKDEPSYSLFCTALDASGISRWSVKSLTAGESLAAGLKSAIASCDLCVFIATENSLSSRWCLAELCAFWGAGKRVILFLVDPKLSEDDIPPQFKGNLWTRNAQDVIQSIHSTTYGSVRPTRNGYQLKLGDLKLNVVHGRIEHAPCGGPDCVIALPANEYFDDECISDSRSALGAYMQLHFGDRISEIQELINAQLAGHPFETVEKRPNEPAASYGIGSCLLLDRPLGTDQRIALVSVTTQRADAGLQASPGDIFKAAESIQRMMANHRLTRLHLPLMGAGHGGLRSKESLLCTLLAFTAGHSVRRPREVTITVFRANEDDPPDVPLDAIKSALDLTCYCLDRSGS